MQKWGKKILKMIQENKESKEQVKDQEIKRRAFHSRYQNTKNISILNLTYCNIKVVIQ